MVSKTSNLSGNLIGLSCILWEVLSISLDSQYFSMLQISPPKDPETDKSACIPYRLYGDGAESQRI